MIKNKRKFFSWFVAGVAVVIALLSVVGIILSTSKADGIVSDKEVASGTGDQTANTPAVQTIVIEDTNFIGDSVFIKSSTNTAYTIKNCTFKGGSEAEAAIVIDGGEIILKDTVITKRDAVSSEVSNGIDMNAGKLTLLGASNISYHATGINISGGEVVNLGVQNGTTIDGVQYNSGGGWTGQISHNTNHGIFMAHRSGADVNMYGGWICDNTAEKNAGGVYVHASASAFNMYGGVISYNSVTPVIDSSGRPESQGGAIRAYGANYADSWADVNIYGGTIANNQAVSGAAIQAQGAARINIAGGNIRYNYLDTYSEYQGYATGGAIAINGTYNGSVGNYVHFNMSGGTLEYNEAISGGGIWAYNPGNFVITGGEINYNTARGETAAGGIYVFGVREDLNPNDPNTVGTMTRLIGLVDIMGNYSGYGSNTETCASDVMITNASFQTGKSTWDFEEVYIESNELLLRSLRVMNVKAVNFDSAQVQGTVALDGVATINVNNSSIWGGGGSYSGIYTNANTSATQAITNLVIKDSEITGFEYGVNIKYTNLRVDSGNIYENTASGIYSSMGNSLIEIYGGQIYDNGNHGVETTSTQIKMYGGEIYSNGNTDVAGGGIWSNGGWLTITAGKIYGNQGSDGAGIYKNVGAVLLDGTLEMYDNVASNVGGAIWFSGEGSQTSLEGVKFYRNSAVKGGAIYVHRGTMDITKSVIGGETLADANTASDSGGGITSSGSGSSIACYDTTTMKYNTASLQGGAMFLYAGTHYLTDLRVENNSANTAGAIFTQNACTLTLTDCDFVSNKADGGTGGAISVAGASTIYIEGGSFQENSANFGGAIHSKSNDASIYINRDKDEFFAYEYTLFEDNSADFGGAVVIGAGLTFSALNAQFLNNFSSEYGGAMWLYDGAQNVTLYYEMEYDGNEYTNATPAFSGNKSKRGGAIMCENLSKLEIYGGLFEGNAALTGGAIDVISGSEVTVSTFGEYRDEWDDIVCMIPEFVGNYVTDSIDVNDKTITSSELTNYRGGAVSVSDEDSVFNCLTNYDDTSFYGNPRFEGNYISLSGSGNAFGGAIAIGNGASGYVSGNEYCELYMSGNWVETSGSGLLVGGTVMIDEGNDDKSVISSFDARYATFSSGEKVQALIGGAFGNMGSLTISNSLVAGSATYGGGIGNLGTLCSLENVQIDGNSATSGYGGAMLTGGQVNITGSFESSSDICLAYIPKVSFLFTTYMEKSTGNLVLGTSDFAPDIYNSIDVTFAKVSVSINSLSPLSFSYNVTKPTSGSENMISEFVGKDKALVTYNSPAGVLWSTVFETFGREIEGYPLCGRYGVRDSSILISQPGQGSTDSAYPYVLASIGVNAYGDIGSPAWSDAYSGDKFVVDGNLILDYYTGEEVVRWYEVGYTEFTNFEGVADGTEVEIMGDNLYFEPVIEMSQVRVSYTASDTYVSSYSRLYRYDYEGAEGELVMDGFGDNNTKEVILEFEVCAGYGYDGFKIEYLGYEYMEDGYYYQVKIQPYYNYMDAYYILCWDPDGDVNQDESYYTNITYGTNEKFELPDVVGESIYFELPNNATADSILLVPEDADQYDAFEGEIAITWHFSHS